MLSLKAPNYLCCVSTFICTLWIPISTIILSPHGIMLRDFDLFNPKAWSLSAYMTIWKQRRRVSRPLALVLSWVVVAEQAACGWCFSPLGRTSGLKAHGSAAVSKVLCISECLTYFISKEILENLYQTLVDSCYSIATVNFNDKLKVTCQVCTCDINMYKYYIFLCQWI